LEITLRHTTLGRTPLDELSARHRDLSLTKHNILKRQTTMPPVRFEPEIPVSQRPQTYALGRAVTGIGWFPYSGTIILQRPVNLTATWRFLFAACELIHVYTHVRG